MNCRNNKFPFLCERILQTKFPCNEVFVLIIKIKNYEGKNTQHIFDEGKV